VVLALCVSLLGSLRPSVARPSRGGDDDGGPANLELDLIGEARLLDDDLWEPNAPGISNSDEVSLHG